MNRCELVVVLVHHRTPERILPAVTALRKQAKSASCEARVIVVDQSGDAPSGETWELVRPIDNSGYAGGFNAAVRAAPDAAYYLLINPDVELEEGALGQLIRHALPQGAVGPALFWDEEYRLIQPPTREPEVPAWLRGLGTLSSALAHRRGRGRWRRHARRHWLAEQPHPTRHLSGACLLIGGAAIKLIGPMDERFRLYYEETDWLRRLWKAGERSLLIPSARAVHEFDASASQEPRRDEWFAQSESLYRLRYSVGSDLPALDQALPRWTGSTSASARSMWFELSPFAGGVPAAAERIERESGSTLTWSPPAALIGRTKGFVLTLADDGGREAGRYRLGGSE